MRFNDLLHPVAFPGEGAWETSGTRFRNCCQDAGFPCAFQVLRPISVLTCPCQGGTPALLEYQCLGSSCARAAAHRLMVCGSRSKASAVAAAVHPWASSSMAYHLSRSRGVGARIIRRRKSGAFICHCSRDRSISLAPITNPTSTLRQANPVASQSTPCPCAFHLGFGLVR